MLDITCVDCGRTLIGARQIISMTATPEGLRIAYVCWCGRPGAETTGRRRRGTTGPRVTARRPVATAA